MSRPYIPNSELLEGVRDASREVGVRKIIEKTCIEIGEIFKKDTKEILRHAEACRREGYYGLAEQLGYRAEAMEQTKHER